MHFVDDDPVRDQQAEDALRQAAADAGFENISFQPEPIAAALDYEQRIDHEAVVLVVDIGGGTSDFTVVRLGLAAWGTLTAWTMCWPPPACMWVVRTLTAA